MDQRIAALRARIAGLSPQERDQFRARVEAAGIDWARVAPADRTARPERLPLSPAQMHFWLGQQVHPDSAAFSIAFAWQIDGPLNQPALARTLEWLVDRHEPLRTAFPQQDGQPWQQIGPAGFALELADVTPAGVEQASRDFAARPFDLAQAPLFRARLLRLGPQSHRLLFSFHHIIADGWSRGVFLRELAESYRAFCADEPPRLPDLPRQFADLVLEQNRWLTSDEAAGAEAFWRRELDGLAPQDLPAQGAGQDHLAGTLLHRVSAPLAERVAPAAAAMGVSPFVLLLAVFQLLLHRLSGSEDIAVGTPVAGRNDAESAGMIGLFVNTLVLRGRPQPGLRFRDWVERARQGFARAFDHQALPFARVVEVTGADRRAGQTPLFQTLFQVQSGYGAQNAELVDLGDPDLTVRQSVLPLPQAKFDLSWHMIDRDGSLSVIAEYRRSLFADDTIRRMAARFDTLLASALDRPDAAIETLDFVPTDDVTVLRGPEMPIPDLLAMIRAAAPQARLVDAATGQQVLTGLDLLAQAGALARCLRARPELQDGRPVAICLPRGPRMVVALLAALMAGIAYVPLDPAHPDGRREMILRDSGAGLLLSDDPDGPGLTPEALALGDQADLPAPDPVSDPDRIAYVIFTSGSTGRPKGVPVRHRALSNLIASMAVAPGMEPGDCLLALTTIAFDIAALELFLPLATGATLVLADAAALASPDRLAAALKDHRVTHMQATPATWRLLVDDGWTGDPALVALCGGEALASDLGRELLARVGALWNMYGPTETTIWSAARRVEPDDLAGPQARIGGPVANTSLQVLDRYGHALPPGVPGELAIGGAGLSPGYWQRPDLTADRFRGGLYLTGDRVRLEGDGTLIFLGRLDHQIKLNGYRIEPGEVESALREQPGIAEALVLADEGRLIAYCRADGPAPDQDRLRADLARQLPAYMVPAAVVMLQAFPLNPNGKIDRARLPRPGAGAAGPSRAPATAAERQLLAIWQGVLGRDDIGIEDNFFAIGGASVSAMQIASRARAAGLMLSPAQMFEHQTVAAQAAVAGASTVRATFLPLSPWQVARREAPEAARVLRRPVAAEAAGRLPAVIEAITAAHPVLSFTLAGDGWHTGSRSGLWGARIAGDVLELSADPLLLDARSSEALADALLAALRGEAVLPGAGDYADWLTRDAPADVPCLAPLTGDALGEASLTQHLNPATLRAVAQRLTAAPSRIVAAALARVLAPWTGGDLTLLLAEDAPAKALGNFGRLLPVRIRPGADLAGSVRALTGAETAADPRGIDPRALPDGAVVLSWDQPHDFPGAALHLAVTTAPDGLTLTWHSTTFHPQTLARLAARLLAELSVSPSGGSSGLDRLRARLKEPQ